jgi:hypothetical protein
MGWKSPALCRPSNERAGTDAHRPPNLRDRRRGARRQRAGTHRRPLCPRRWPLRWHARVVQPARGLCSACRNVARRWSRTRRTCSPASMPCWLACPKTSGGVLLSIRGRRVLTGLIDGLSPRLESSRSEQPLDGRPRGEAWPAQLQYLNSTCTPTVRARPELVALSTPAEPDTSPRSQANR